MKFKMDNRIVRVLQSQHDLFLRLVRNVVITT